VPASRPPVTSISDLRPARVATIEATVVQLGPIRVVDNRSGGRTKTRNARLKDGTGEIDLFLWGSEVELVQEGDPVRITDGWVEDYQGQPQISLGERGKLEKLPAESRGVGLPH
jgi:ssDNA-binding replication factor A large subunit